MTMPVAGIRSRLARHCLALALAVALGTATMAPRGAHAEGTFEAPPLPVETEFELLFAVALTAMVIPLQEMIIWDTPEGRQLLKQSGPQFSSAGFRALLAVALMGTVINMKRQTLLGQQIATSVAIALIAPFSIPAAASQ